MSPEQFKQADEFIYNFVTKCKQLNHQELNTFINEEFAPKNPLQTINNFVFSKNSRRTAVERALVEFCEKGDLEKVKILYQNKHTKKHIDIEKDYSSFFRSACKFGHKDIVEYLLLSEDVKNKPFINVAIPGHRGKFGIELDYSTVTKVGAGTPLLLAAENNHNDIVELLLNAELIQQTNVDENIQNAFGNALAKKNIDGARIILNNSNIKETMFKTASKKNDKAQLQLYYAITNNELDVVDFLLDECKMEYKNYFEKNNLEMHEKMLSIILAKQLDTELDQSPKSSGKKMKI